jgi:hypothetical protein
VEISLCRNTRTGHGSQADHPIIRSSDHPIIDTKAAADAALPTATQSLRPSPDSGNTRRESESETAKPLLKYFKKNTPRDEETRADDRAKHLNLLRHIE